MGFIKLLLKHFHLNLLQYFKLYTKMMFFSPKSLCLLSFLLSVASTYLSLKSPSQTVTPLCFPHTHQILTVSCGTLCHIHSPSPLSIGKTSGPIWTSVSLFPNMQKGSLLRISSLISDILDLIFRNLHNPVSSLPLLLSNNPTSGQHPLPTPGRLFLSLTTPVVAYSLSEILYYSTIYGIMPTIQD